MKNKFFIAHIKNNVIISIIMYITRTIFNNLNNWNNIIDDEVNECKTVIKQLFSDLSIDLLFTTFYVSANPITETVWVNETTPLQDAEGNRIKEIIGCKIIISNNVNCNYSCYELYIDKSCQLIFINLLEEKNN